MGRPRFLADHDLNEHIVLGVQRREPAAEFLRARELGLSESADDRVLEHAARTGLIVVSHDVNSMAKTASERLAARKPMTGLLMVRQSNPVRSAIEDLVLIWSATEGEEWRDQIWFLPIR